jgi:hypothetical protein
MSTFIQYNFNSTSFVSPNIIQNIGSGGSSYNGRLINNPITNSIGPEPQIMSILFNFMQSALFRKFELR